MKPNLAARRSRSEDRAKLDAATVLKEYEQKGARKPRLRMPVAAMAAAGLAIVGIAVAVVVLLLRPGEQSIPGDPKARSEFMDSQSAKLTDDQRRLLTRFLARVQAQEAAGGPSPKVTIAKAVELQSKYDNDVVQAQTRYQQQLAAAKADVRVDIREQGIVKEDPAKSPAGKSLRYAMDISNTGKRVIDSVTLRVEFRDASRKYLAATPSLELRGPLKGGESGRSVQTLPLNPKYHQYILDGGVVQISASPVQVAYVDGEKLDADKELKALEALNRVKIE
jgi:hypothetical protein